MVAMATATIAIVSVVGRPRRITSTIDHNAPSVPRPVDAIAHFTIPRKCSLLVMMDAQTTPQTSPVIADTTCWATGRWLCSMFHQCCAGDAKRGSAHRNVAAVSVSEGRDQTRDPRTRMWGKSSSLLGATAGLPGGATRPSSLCILMKEEKKEHGWTSQPWHPEMEREEEREEVALPLTPPISCCALDRRGGGNRQTRSHSPSSLAAASW
jgi:hypothetical protein